MNLRHTGKQGLTFSEEKRNFCSINLFVKLFFSFEPVLCRLVLRDLSFLTVHSLNHTLESDQCATKATTGLYCCQDGCLRLVVSWSFLLY